MTIQERHTVLRDRDDTPTDIQVERASSASGSGRRAVSYFAVGALVLGSTAAYLVIALIRRHDMLGMLDLSIYRSGGSVAWHHGPLYEQHFAAGLSFTYPPIAAIAFEPAAAVPTWAANSLMLGASIASLAAVNWLILASVHDTRRRMLLAGFATAVGLWLEPVQQTLRFGQINILLMLIIVADLMQPDERRRKGLGVGLAAAIKLTPAIYVPYLLLTRRRRAAANACGAFAACCVVGFLLLPSQSVRYWFHGLFYNSDRIGNVGYLANQSIHGVLVRILGESGREQLIWLAVAIAVAALGLWIAAVAYSAVGEAAGILSVALTGLLVSPVSWSHHWVWVVPAIALVGATLSRRHLDAWLFTLVGTLVFFAWPVSRQAGLATVPQGVIWTLPYRLDNHEHLWRGWQLLAGNAEVAFGVLTLLAFGFFLIRMRHQEQTASNSTARGLELQLQAPTP